MDINRTVTMANFEMDPKTGAHFETIRETTSQISDDSLEYDNSELDNLSDICNSYNLGEKFAEGGQGEILSGTDKLLKRFVAIKSLKKGFTKQPEIVNSFISEAIVTAQLDHPSIIPLYGINKDTDGGLHLSMKLVLGETLEDLIAKNMNQCKDAKIEAKALINRLEIFTSVCDAVAYAHEKKILHRDLKPENIMLGSHHDVYVMDWGIAKVLSDDEVEGNKLVSGTPGYIAPEVLRKEAFGPASDQYALGVILFEIITLKSAFKSTTLNGRLMDTVNGQLADFIHCNSTNKLHQDLVAICKKACHVDATQRYISVSALANDIRLFISKQEISARPDNVVRKAYRVIARHRHLVASIVLFALLTSAILIIFSLQKQNEVVKESKARELKLLHLRSNIEQKSHKIDSHFHSLSNLLGRYTDRVEFLLENKVNSGKSLIKDYQQFKAVKNAPAGTLQSSFYNLPINPDYLNYKAPAGLSDTEVNARILPFVDMVDYSLEIITQSDLEHTTETDDPKKQIVNKGFPISWLYFGLENGTIINYPATGSLNADYDPRERPWYQAVKQEKRLIWTEPYKDLFGLGTVISAAQPIYSKSKQFLGVSAFDLTLNYTKKIMTSGKNNPALIANYLIDMKGEVTVATHDSAIHKDLKLDGLLEHIKTGKTGQYKIIKNGREIMVDYAPIPTLSWYYIELIDIEKYLGK